MLATHDLTLVSATHDLTQTVAPYTFRRKQIGRKSQRYMASKIVNT